MVNKGQKILVFFAGLFAAILLLEAGLRLVGGMQKSRSFYKKINGAAEDVYTILCLGNCFTYGTGALAGESYPDHLQRIFDAENKAGKVIVVNRGRPSLNSADILRELETDIKEIKPDLIILMTGGPNFYTRKGYGTYLARTRKDISFFRKMFYYLHDYLYQARVYKLFILLRERIKTKITSKNSTVETEKWLLDALRSKYSNAAASAVDEEKLKEAASLLRKKIEREPNDPRNYLNLGYICFIQDDYEGAIGWHFKGIKATPGFEQNYIAIESVRNYAESEKVNKFTDRLIYQLKKANPSRVKDFMLLTKKEIIDWAGSDTRDIIKIIKSKKIGVIIQNYPYDDTLGENALLVKIANDENIPFVDNERLFQKMRERGENSKDYHVVYSDGKEGIHLNSEGYKVMAVAVYESIRDNFGGCITTGFSKREKID